MATGKQIAAGAVFAMAFAAAGAVGALVLSNPPGGGAAPPPPPPPPPEIIERVPPPRPPDPAREEPRAVAAAPAPTPGPALPADLEVQPDEKEFLRKVLLTERERRAAARVHPDDGGLDILKRVFAAGADPAPLLADFASFRSRVRTGGDVRRIDAAGDRTKVNLAESAGDVAVLEFGAGRFELAREGQEWGNLRKGRKSLEIRGAGMDRTTVVVSIYTLLMIWEGQDLENLYIHDLTLLGTGGSSCLVDVRGRTAAILENVRFRDWIVAGHASPVGVSGEAYLGCTGCEFIGDGNRNGFGLSFRGRVLGVLENCLFRGVDSAVTGTGDAEGSIVRIAGCTFEGSPVADSRVMAGKKPGISISVQGGAVRLGAPGMTEEERRQKWGAGYLASVEGVSFGPATPALTLEQILAVADHVRADAAEYVVRVVALGSGDDGRARYGIRFRKRESMDTRWSIVAADGTPIEPEAKDRGGGAQQVPVEVLAGCLPMAEALRKSAISLSTSAREIYLGPNTGGEPLVHVQAEAGWPTYAVKAKTGEKYAEWK